MTSCTLLFSLSLMGQSSLSGPELQTAEKFLNTCFATWESRRSKILTVRCEAEAQSVVFKGRFNDIIPQKEPIPPKDVHFVKKTSWLIDFQKNRVRKEANSLGFFLEENIWSPIFEIQLFDGKECFSYTPREKNTSASYTPSSHQPDFWVKGKLAQDNFFSFLDYPVLFSCAMIPSAFSHPLPNRLSPTLDREKLRVFDYSVAEGRKCLIARTVVNQHGFLEEYWIDMKTNMVIRWNKQGPQGDAYARLEMIYERSSDGYMPRSWTVTEFASAEHNLLQSDSVSVVSFAVNEELSTSRFQVTPGPGLTVGKTVGNKLELYKVRADGQMQPISEWEREERESRRFSNVIWTIGIMIAIGVVVLVLKNFLRGKRE